MKCRTLTEQLEKCYPLDIAAPWDNPGLQAGRFDKEIHKVYIALDATDQVIEEAIQAKADLLLTHHPLMMEGIKQVNSDSLTGRKLIRMLSQDMCHYAMHTNHDIVKMADLAAGRLDLQDTEILAETTVFSDGRKGGFGKAGRLKEAMSLHEYSEYVKKVFELPSVKVFGDLKRNIQRAAVIPGSGKSMIQDAIKKGVDVLIGGDFGHHDGLDAVDMGLMIIDAGHYGIEHIFIKQMEADLKKEFPELEVQAAEIEHPFHVMI